jgi:hypothetical protein
MTKVKIGDVLTFAPKDLKFIGASYHKLVGQKATVKEIHPHDKGIILCQFENGGPREWFCISTFKIPLRGHHLTKIFK